MRKDCGDPQIAIWHTTPKFTTFFSPNLGHPCVAFSWLTICTSEKMIPMMVFAPAWFGCTFWRSVCQAVPLGSLSSFTPTKWHQTFASGFFWGFHAKKRRSKTWCLSTREHVFYLGTFLYLKSSAPVWVQAFSMMQPMFRKLDQQEVHTTGSEREVCVFVAWAQN